MKLVMLQLNKMNESEFKDFFLSSVLAMAGENIENNLRDPEEALSNAMEQAEFMLKSSSKHGTYYFFSVNDTEINKTIGSLWIDIKKGASNIKSAFIYNINIQEEYRGKGYGENTLKVLQDWLKSQGVSKISLHVYAKNKIARNLYQNFGFIDTSYNMIKFI